jgi:phage terminase large subunit-like protein
LGDGLVKAGWFKRYDKERPEDLKRIVQSWDTANKATELSDFSVCTTWGIRGKDVYLLGLLRQRLEYPALKRAVREQQSLYDATEVLIEDKASGTQLIQELIADGCHRVTRYGALRTVADRLLSVACTLLEQQTLFDPSYEARDAAGA